jgi:hypothetical protein
VLRADTYATGKGSTVAKVVEGACILRAHGIAGVSNVGSDRNWTGSQFNQANWYAFGRLAWNPEVSARAIADEWIRMTFTNAPAVAAIRSMMLQSREAVVNYMTPLGLAHIMATGHHYGPAPWVKTIARRLVADVLPQGRLTGYRLRPDGGRQQRGCAIRATGPRPLREPGRRPGLAAALVPSRAVDVSDAVGANPLGGDGLPVQRRSR